ncbi:hypothetical protein TrVFT333_002605 [Trichoderma virens FT-333]|nr:hypothetical protein TrVFT333_002605 [Trichoderma virens FT-333]
MSLLQPRTDHRFDSSEEHPELDGVKIPDDIDWNNDTDPFGLYASRGLPPPKLMPPAEVRREAKDKTRKIFSDYRRLQAIVERHESTIQKRWEKKTRTQRLAILLEAWPDMPIVHRPEFAAFRKYPRQLHAAAATHYGSFMWPYINQEDLAKPKSLLMLLNARARNHPSVFAATDGDAMHLGKVSCVIVPIFLNEYVMMMNGVTREEDYGKLVGWHENDDAFQWMSTRKQALPGEGLITLEAQSRLLAFLTCCCEKILHDIPQEQLTSDAYPIQPEPSLKPSNDSGGLGSLVVLAEEAPYRVPAKLDLGKIESLLAARAARAEDHIWTLREDPSYFADQLFELKEHRNEAIKDVLGNVHPTMKPPRENLLWARLIGNVVTDAYLQLELFSELHSQANKLQALQKKYESDISPLRDLPEEYLDALLKFRYYLEQIAKGPLNQLKEAVVASPPMRGFYVRDVPESATSSKMRIVSKPGMKKDKIAESLTWLLQTLWEDGYDLFLCRLPTVVDELERLLKAEQKARDLVSPYIAGLIGELSILAECLRQVDIYQPWANGFENAMVDKEKGIKARFAERTATMGRVMEALRDQNLLKVCSFGDPSDKKFDYPIGKRRNKENVDKLRAAEVHLDLFWSKIDELILTKVGRMDGTALGRLLSQPRLLQRTPEWVDTASQKDEKPKKKSVIGSNDPTKQFSFSEPEPSSLRKEVLAAGAPKAKVKSRGTPNSLMMNSMNVTEPIVPIERELDPQPTLQVDSRALKVFRIVFFDPAANTTPGEVAWNDFLHALISVGFSAEKLSGSVWQFQPSGLDVERGIQFHEPHPRGKIPF